MVSMVDDVKFTFDDILLVPQHNPGYEHCKYVGSTKLFDFDLKLPIISSPMDSVTGTTMMQAMLNAGGVGIHHRYCDYDDLKYAAGWGGIAISPSIPTHVVASIFDSKPETFFCLDVGHGDTDRNIDYCAELIKMGIKNIISGNICTVDAMKRYIDVGVTHLRVGVGGGAACLTRVVTGFGYPQASAVRERYKLQEIPIDYTACEIRDTYYFVVKNKHDNVKIISDGGHNTTGDIVKAFAMGADYVMLGKMLHSKQSPTPGLYRGMASQAALETRKSDFFVEGEQMIVENVRDTSDIMKEIYGAIEKACYYGGVDHYSKLKNNPFVMITNNSFREGLARK